MARPKNKVILVIRDGWGYRKSPVKNAVRAAKTPETDALMKKYPNTLLKAAGEAVGLPKGYQGNSEVGHMALGAGRIIKQSLTRINKAIKTGKFFEKPALRKAIDNCKKNKSALHIMGLLQTEGVHSHINHLFALLDLCKRKKFTKNVYIHVFTDGRDAPVTESVRHIRELESKIRKMGGGPVIATVSGRYYAMDRDRRWKRTRKAYDCIVNAKAEESFNDPLKQVRECHQAGETDEFIKPRKAEWYEGVKPNDSMIFFNFRTDRTRQLTKAIVEKDFKGWKRKPLDVYFAAMTEYYEGMNAEIAFEEIPLKNLLGGIISREGWKQLRISETEKYAHVTFFFNGQEDEPYRNEDRILIHSPKVATYDKKPEMSVFRIKGRVVGEIKKGKYDLIITNLVNGDMVGHTGNWNATIKALEAVDKCLGEIVRAGRENNYDFVICADHGNAEDMTEKWRTSHTINPVPCIVISDKAKALKRNKGLKDVAPTILDIMGLKKPKDMTGETLIK